MQKHMGAVMDEYFLKNVKFQYPDSDFEAIDIDSLTIIKSEFICITGKCSSGKSTLARLLAGFIPRFSGGNLSGEALFQNKNITEFPEAQLRKSIGLVFQDPKRQVVMNNVKQDLIFALNNLGFSQKQIEKRIPDITSLLDLTKLQDRSVSTLSSGELQKVAIAATLLTSPQVLILDEPTSHLAPQAAKQIISFLKDLNREHNITVVLVSQQLSNLLDTVDRFIVLDKGKITFEGTASQFVDDSKLSRKWLLPTHIQVSNGPFSEFSIREARKNISQGTLKNGWKPGNNNSLCQDALMKLKSVSFSYSQSKSARVLRDTSLDISSGEVLSLVGDNGAGKSTLLKIIAGLLKPLKGQVFLKSRIFPENTTKYYPKEISYLSENARLHLFSDTLKQEIQNTCSDDREWLEEVLNALSLNENLEYYIDQLSLGVTRKAALASCLLNKPSLLLLDEPSAGLDGEAKDNLSALIRSYVNKHSGTVIIAGQDLDFISDVSDRIALLNSGKIIDVDIKEKLLHDNLFFTTDINRTFRGIVNNIVNRDQALEVINQ